MSTIREKLQSPECESMRRHLLDLDFLVMAAARDLEVARSRYEVAMHEFKNHLGFDFSDSEKQSYETAVSFLNGVEDEKA